MRFLAIPLIFVALSVGAAQTPAPRMPTGTPVPSIGQPAKPDNTEAYSSIEGHVTAADTGAPLRGARVELMGSGSAVAPRLNRTAVTDRRGQYRFDEVPAGRYLISASRPGFVTMRAGQKHPLARSELWTVTSSTTDRLDFVLPRGSVIAGRLTDTNGEPLPGIRMTTLKVAYSPNGERLFPFSPLQVTTDDRGAFRVAGLGPGTYVLVARGEPVESGERLVTTYYPGTTNPHEAERFEIGLSGQVSASFSMREGRTARISGYIQSSNGTPLQGARLALRTAGGVSEGGSRVQNASGAFELNNVAPGDYILDVSPSAPGGMPDFFKQTEFTSVKLSVGTEDLTGLVVTTGPGTTVAGRVIYEGASPPRPSSQVFVEIIDTGAGIRSPSSDRDNGRIAEDGSFTVKGGFGKMLFRAGQPGWLLKSVSLNGTDMTDVPYRLEPRRYQGPRDRAHRPAAGLERDRRGCVRQTGRSLCRRRVPERPSRRRRPRPFSETAFAAE